MDILILDYEWRLLPTCERTNFSLSQAVPGSRSVRTIEKASGRQAGSAFSLPDPARRQPAFYNRPHWQRAWNRPGTGYFFSVFSELGPPENLTLLNVTQQSHNTSTALVTWLPPHNLTDGDAIQVYNLSWTKMPIMSKQTSEPHSDSATLPSVSFFSLLNYLILLVCRSLFV